MKDMQSNQKKSWYFYLSPEQYERVMEHSSLIHFRKDETIIKQGFIASHILYLEEGMAKLSVEDQNRRTVLKIVALGSFIGLMCSFVKRTFVFSAVAIRPSTVRLIERSVFEDMIRENGELAVALIYSMSVDTHKMVHDLVHLSHKYVHGALSTVLSQLSDIFGSHSFQIPLSRVELANIVGYSTESVINCLSSLQKDNIISISGKNINIIDIKRLEMIARHG